MKYLFLFILSLTVLIACSDDPKAKMIKEHEETILGVQTDLSFKLKDLEFIQEITGMDSMKLIHERIFPKDTFDINKNYIDTFYNIYSASLDKSEKTYIYYDSMINNTTDHEIALIYLQAQRELIPIKLDDSKAKRKWSIEKDKYDYYTSIKDRIIGRLYEATYTIKNPLLNNAKQTITKQYIFSPDELVIINEIPIEESKFSK